MSARDTILPVFVPHLGCPHNCLFCNQHRISGQNADITPDTVRKIIRRSEQLYNGKKRPQLAYYGGSFTAIPEEKQIALLEVAKEALEKGSISSIRISTRPDAISETVLMRLKSYGVNMIELGAQSLCDEVLKLSGRGHSAESVRSASNMIREARIGLILQMMTGLPGDTPERSIFTAEEIISLKPDGVRIYPTVIVRDTALFTLWERGKYREHTLEEAVSLCSELVPRFEAANIPVIRIGLNPTEELTAGDAAAGAYHPALGELVHSRIFRNEAERLLKDVPAGSRICLKVNSQKISQMIGQHRENICYLQEHFQLADLQVKSSTDLHDREISFIIENT